MTLPISNTGAMGGNRPDYIMNYKFYVKPLDVSDS